MLDPIILSSDEGIDLSSFKLHAHIDDSERDKSLQEYVRSAIDYLQGYSGVLGKSVLPQSVVQWLPTLTNELSIPYGAVAAITSIEYYSGGELVLLDNSYRLFRKKGMDIVLVEGGLPSSDLREDSVKVTYETEQASDDVMQIVRILAAHWFDNSHAVTDTKTYSVPIGFDTLVFKNKSQHI